jgi:hypothetical protein
MFNVQDVSIEQINGEREIAVSKVAPRLAQWMAPVYFKNGSQPLIPKGTWHEIWSRRRFGDSGLHGVRVSC